MSWHKIGKSLSHIKAQSTSTADVLINNEVDKHLSTYLPDDIIQPLFMYPCQQHRVAEDTRAMVAVEGRAWSQLQGFLLVLI